MLGLTALRRRVDLALGRLRAGCTPAALAAELASRGYRWHSLGRDGELRSGPIAAGARPEAAALLPGEA